MPVVNDRKNFCIVKNNYFIKHLEFFIPGDMMIMEAI